MISTPLFKSSVLLVLVTASLFSGSAAAQSAKVMREKDISESSLIDALTPPEPPPGATRSFGPARPAATRVPVTVPVKPASASLLITFETNSAELTPQAKQSLSVVGRALNSDKLIDFRFAVEGHADPRGEPGSNLDLSKQRAEAVRNYLVQNSHVEERRLEAIGKGDRELLNKANPYAPENRRVAIVNLSE